MSQCALTLGRALLNDCNVKFYKEYYILLYFINEDVLSSTRWQFVKSLFFIFFVLSQYTARMISVSTKHFLNLLFLMARGYK